MTVLTKGKFGHRHAQREKTKTWRVPCEKGIGVRLLQAKECQRSLVNHQKLRGKELSLQVSEEHDDPAN